MYHHNSCILYTMIFRFWFVTWNLLFFRMKPKTQILQIITIFLSLFWSYWNDGKIYLGWWRLILYCYWWLSDHSRIICIVDHLKRNETRMNHWMYRMHTHTRTNAHICTRLHAPPSNAMALAHSNFISFAFKEIGTFSFSWHLFVLSFFLLFV